MHLRLRANLLRREPMPGGLPGSGHFRTELNGEVRIIEMPDHPFFVGTLFVPRSQSTELMPHRLVSGFLRAVLRRRTVRGANLQIVDKSYVSDEHSR